MCKRLGPVRVRHSRYALLLQELGGEEVLVEALHLERGAAAIDVIHTDVSLHLGQPQHEQQGDATGYRRMHHPWPVSYTHLTLPTKIGV